MKIYLATWLLEPSQGLSLTNVNARNRLISYFHTQQKEKFLKNYVITGIVK